jgi:hypothetical protein
LRWQAIALPVQGAMCDSIDLYNGISVFAVILESKKPVNRSYIIHSFHIKKELQGFAG